MFYNFLFPNYCREKVVSWLILAVRVFFGILFFTHGVSKLMNFNYLVDSYPDVLGFGSYMSLMVTIFCEFCCSMFLVAGLLQRIVVLPMIAAMAVAFFDVHDAVFPEGELAFIYMIVFLMLFFTGPGRYSVDYLLVKKFNKETNEIYENKKNQCKGNP